MLYKKCRPVTEFNPRLHLLLDDLKDTLAQADGVGLAAPQLGILRRAVVVIETNVPEGEEERFIELVNPEIVSAEGEQTGPEGCLSAPGEYGIVERPMKAFISILEKEGVNVTVRRRLGSDVDASCGQLRRKFEAKS